MDGDTLRWFGGHAGTVWPALALAAVCVLAVAVKVAVALTYAGPVTVTANMGRFSPNPVRVKTSATSSFSANYTPPSWPDEYLFITFVPYLLRMQRRVGVVQRV